MSILGSIILLIATADNIKVLADDSMAKAFQDSCIVPDILAKAPDQMATVQYPRVEINLGTTVNPIQVAVKPSVSWKADPEKYYTLIMVGDLIPGKVGGVQHWLVVNIPDNHVDNGEVLSAYVPPTPPFIRFHYVFLIYEQLSKQNFKELGIPGITTFNRLPFSLANFVEKYNFSDPIAGNFFMASPLDLNFNVE